MVGMIPCFPWGRKKRAEDGAENWALKAGPQRLILVHVLLEEMPVTVKGSGRAGPDFPTCIQETPVQLFLGKISFALK